MPLSTLNPSPSHNPNTPKVDPSGLTDAVRNVASNMRRENFLAKRSKAIKAVKSGEKPKYIVPGEGIFNKWRGPTKAESLEANNAMDQAQVSYTQDAIHTGYSQARVKFAEAQDAEARAGVIDDFISDSSPLLENLPADSVKPVRNALDRYVSSMRLDSANMDVREAKSLEAVANARLMMNTRDAIQDAIEDGDLESLYLLDNDLIQANSDAERRRDALQLQQAHALRILIDDARPKAAKNAFENRATSASPDELQTLGANFISDWKLSGFKSEAAAKRAMLDASGKAIVSIASADVEAFMPPDGWDDVSQIRETAASVTEQRFAEMQEKYPWFFNEKSGPGAQDFKKRMRDSVFNRMNDLPYADKEKANPQAFGFDSEVADAVANMDAPAFFIGDPTKTADNVRKEQIRASANALFSQFDTAELSDGDKETFRQFIESKVTARFRTLPNLRDPKEAKPTSGEAKRRERVTNVNFKSWYLQGANTRPSPGPSFTYVDENGDSSEYPLFPPGISESHGELEQSSSDFAFFSSGRDSMNGAGTDPNRMAINRSQEVYSAAISAGVPHADAEAARIRVATQYAESRRKHDRTRRFYDSVTRSGYLDRGPNQEFGTSGLSKDNPHGIYLNDDGKKLMSEKPDEFAKHIMRRIIRTAEEKHISPKEALKKIRQAGGDGEVLYEFAQGYADSSPETVEGRMFSGRSAAGVYNQRRIAWGLPAVNDSGIVSNPSYAQVAGQWLLDNGFSAQDGDQKGFGNPSYATSAWADVLDAALGDPKQYETAEDVIAKLDKEILGKTTLGPGIDFDADNFQIPTADGLTPLREIVEKKQGYVVGPNGRDFIPINTLSDNPGSPAARPSIRAGRGGEVSVLPFSFRGRIPKFAIFADDENDETGDSRLFLSVEGYNTYDGRPIYIALDRERIQ